MLDNERAQYQRTIREKQYNLRNKVNELNQQMRVEKQNIVRLEMDKQQLNKDLSELKEELVKVKASEKKLKAEVNEEKLKNSKAIQDALKSTVAQNAMPAQANALGYQGYLAR